MQITHLRKKLGFIFLSGFLLVSCNNDAYLKQASKLSQNAQELQLVFEYQATDYIETCYRRANHETISTISTSQINTSDSDSPDSEDLAPTPDSDNLDSENLVPAPYKKRYETKLGCSEAERLQARDSFILQNQIISQYLIAIANLAQDDNFTLWGSDEKSKVEGLVNKLFPTSSESEDSSSSLSSINPGKAFSTLVNFIYEAQAKSFAKNQIKAEIIRINPEFQQVVCYFKLGWEKTYGRQLNFEEEAVNDYYYNTIDQVIQRDRLDFERNALDNQNLRQTLYQTAPDEDNLLTNYVAYPEVYEFDQEWQKKLEALQQKKSALAEYIKILDKIAAAHASLDQASGGEGKGQPTYCQQSDSPQVKLQDLDAYLQEISQDIKALKAAQKNK